MLGNPLDPLHARLRGQAGECNGVAERFIRTLKEAREVIGAFIERYNDGWLLQRHGYMTPARARGKPSTKGAGVAPRCQATRDPVGSDRCPTRR